MPPCYYAKRDNGDGEDAARWHHHHRVGGCACAPLSGRGKKEGILSNHHQAEDGAANSIIRKLEVTYLWYSMPLSRSESYYRIVQPFYG